MTPAVSFEKEAELIAAQAEQRARAGVPGVYRCIVQVSGEIAKEGISKTRTNQQQGYKFRGIDDVHNALAPMLAKHGLVILPRCLSRDVVERQTAKGGTLFYVTVEAEFDFVCAADGSTHTVRMYGEAMDSADKATNKAMSAAYKYAAFQTFCIPTEGEDADAETHDIVAAPAPSGPPAPGAREERETRPAATGETRGPLPTGAVTIVRVDHTSTKNPNVTKHLLTTSTGETFSTIKDAFARAAEVYRQQATPVRVTGTKTKWGLELVTLERVASPSEGPVYAVDDDDSVPF